MKCAPAGRIIFSIRSEFWHPKKYDTAMVALTIPMNHDDDDDDIHSHGCVVRISKTGYSTKIDFDK